MNSQTKALWIGGIVSVAALLVLIPLRAADFKSSSQTSATTESVSQAQPLPATQKVEVVELLEILRIQMLVRHLELSKEQLLRFFPLFEELQRARNQFTDDRRIAMKRLQTVDTRFSTEEEKLAALNAMKDMEDGYLQEVQRIKEELNRQLTPRQQVKFALFNQIYQKKMRALVASLKEVGEARKPHIDIELMEQTP